MPERFSGEIRRGKKSPREKNKEEQEHEGRTRKGEKKRSATTTVLVTAAHNHTAQSYPKQRDSHRAKVCPGTQYHTSSSVREVSPQTRPLPTRKFINKYGLGLSVLNIFRTSPFVFVKTHL